jgi:uncharacterized SAM-dependent methyltransferase
MKYSSINFNHYTTSRELEKEYLTGLQTRQIPTKFRFIGEEHAQAWFKICHSSDYTYYQNPFNFIKDISKTIASHIKSDVNLIGLGSCNGMKDVILLKEFLINHKSGLFLVDQSKEIIDGTLGNITELNIPKEVFISNITKPNLTIISNYLREHYYPINFYTLLGNTLGNYPQAEIIKTFRDSMHPEDFFLVEAHVLSSTSINNEAQQIDEIIANYNNKAYNEQILLSLSRANIQKSDGIIEVEYTSSAFFPKITVVEHYFKFKRNKAIRYLNEDIYFAKGERVLVSYSNKYTLKSLSEIITDHGLKIVKTFEFRDKTIDYATLLCQVA